MFIAGIVGGITGLLFLAVSILIFVFWVFMLIDSIKNSRLSSNERLLWVLVIIFLGPLGALIYALAGRK